MALLRLNGETFDEVHPELKESWNSRHRVKQAGVEPKPGDALLKRGESKEAINETLVPYGLVARDEAILSTDPRADNGPAMPNWSLVKATGYLVYLTGKGGKVVLKTGISNRAVVKMPGGLLYEEGLGGDGLCYSISHERFRELGGAV